MRLSILFWLIPQLTKKILNLFLKCVYIDLHGSFLVLITFEIYRNPAIFFIFFLKLSHLLFFNMQSCHSKFISNYLKLSRFIIFFYIYCRELRFFYGFLQVSSPTYPISSWTETQEEKSLEVKTKTHRRECMSTKAGGNIELSLLKLCYCIVNIIFKVIMYCLHLCKKKKNKPFRLIRLIWTQTIPSVS